MGLSFSREEGVRGHLRRAPPETRGGRRQAIPFLAPCARATVIVDQSHRAGFIFHAGDTRSGSSAALPRRALVYLSAALGVLGQGRPTSTGNAPPYASPRLLLTCAEESTSSMARPSWSSRGRGRRGALRVVVMRWPPGDWRGTDRHVVSDTGAECQKPRSISLLRTRRTPVTSSSATESRRGCEERTRQSVARRPCVEGTFTLRAHAGPEVPPWADLSPPAARSAPWRS